MAESAVQVQLKELDEVREALELGTKKIQTLTAERDGERSRAEAYRRERDALKAQVDDAYAFLEQGAATPAIAETFRRQPLKVWFQVAANNLREAEARLREAEKS